MKMKRFVSFLLVLCMSISLFGGVSFAAESTGYVYDMGRLQYGQWSDSGVSPETLTDWDALDGLANYHKRTSDPFMFYGKGEGKITIDWNSSSCDYGQGYGVRGTYITGDEGAWYGLIIRVGKDGVYAPAMRAADQTKAATLNYYLAPYGVENPMDEQYLLGQSVTDSSNLYSLTTVNFPNQYLPAGDYVVIIQIAENKAATGCYSFFSRAELNWVSDTPSDALTFEGGMDTGYIDQETVFSVNAFWNASEIALDDLSAFRVDSLDASVATVREENGTFYVLGVWEGETAIRISAQYNDDVTSVDIPITIAMPKGYQRVELWPGEQPEDYFVNEPIVISMRYTLNREEVTGSPQNISVDVLAPDVADAEIDADGNLVITGRAAGSTGVTVTANLSGASASVTIPIAVSDVKYFYNFYRGYYGPWSNSAHSIDYFTDFGMFTKGDLNSGTAPDFWDLSDDWKFGGKSEGFTATVTASFRSYAYTTSGDAGDWINMVIRVPKGGAYRLEALSATVAAGGTYNVYVSPVGTPEEDLLSAEYFVNQLDCSGAGTMVGQLVDLGNVTLESGDYNVVYEFDPQKQVGNGGFLCGLYLKAITEDQFRLFANSPDPIAETANGRIPLTARLNGGSVGFADVENLAVSSANEWIATADVVRKGDEAYLDVYGASPGKTTLTVTGTRNGLFSSYEIEIDIAESDRIRDVTLSAEKTVLAAGESIQTVLNGTYYDGSAVDFADTNVYYESSDGTVLFVDGNGVVTAKEKGESIVRVWVQQGEHLVSYSLPIVVGDYSDVAEAVLNAPDELKRGSRTTLSVTLKLVSGLVIPQDQYSVVYSIESLEPTNCARISGATLQARAVGTATVKATVTFSGKESVCYKTVSFVETLSSDENAVVPDAAVAEIQDPLMSVGETRTVILGAYYTDGSFVEYDADTMDLTYDAAIISYEDGVIRALQSGSTDFTLTAGAVSKTVRITVDDDVLGSAAVEVSGGLYAGKRAELVVHAYTASGRALRASDLEIGYAVANEEIATVENGVVVGVKAGKTSITVTVWLAGAEVSAIVPITVLDNAAQKLTLTADTSVMKPSSATGIQTTVYLVTASGDMVPADVSDVTFESLTDNILTVNEFGLVLPSGTQGIGTIRASMERDGVTLTADFDITVREGKVGSTYFTAERREAIRKNAASTEWAKERVDAAVEKGEQYAGREDSLIRFITTQELPRSVRTTYRYDPMYQYCAYCGEDIVAVTGNMYPWLFDSENYPFKIQCPICRRRFPSNDFKSFYETGIDAEGNWRYQQALERGSHLLTNDMYPEKGDDWGVDDGYGYGTGEYFDGYNGRQERTYTWIAYWNHWGNWYSNGITYQAISNLTYAYAYSGKPEYGRTLAILVDRVADLYPDMDTDALGADFYQNGWYGGKIVGGIWETGVASTLARAYDAAFDMYEDEYVLGYIQKNAEKWGKTNKDSATEIRQHIEDDLLREIRDSIYDRRIYGNTGMHEATMANAAVILDNMPESKEMIDWVLTTGPSPMLNNLISQVDREGQGTENSTQYNSLWVNSYSGIAEVLGGYTAYPMGNLYTNPKYVKMLKMNFPLTMTRNYTLQIGDSGGFASTDLYLNHEEIGKALVNGCEDPELAQMLYALNGNSAVGSYGRSLMVDAEELKETVQRLVNEHGKYDFDKSTQMPAFGVGILRGGTYVEGTVQNINTQRSVALWYGSTAGHGQADTLSLMMDAYGLNVMPSFGYPTHTLTTGDITNWERATISKNTVVVNDKKQTVSASQSADKIGKPLHFDDAGTVKLVDAQNLAAYNGEGVSEYRRTAVMVEVSDADAYTLDFFRIKGGDEHVYSFHANSNEITEYEGLNPVSQPMGTYAGPDVPFGPGAVASGYDGFYNVYRSSYPGAGFSVDFKIHDFRKVLKENRDIHVRMTQLNDFELSDVSMASARPPMRNDNPDEIKYVLARRSGSDLDSLFTTVIEPYDKNRFIDKIEAVKTVRTGGASSTEPAKAVKVTLKNGRVDYVVYAANNQVRYRVDDRFDFIGFVGVVSYINDEIVYRYMHDGKMIDGMYGDASVTGKVVDFTKDLAFENEITISLDQACDAENMIGKTIIVKNTLARNATYWIHGATENPDGTVTLDIGDITPIESKTSSGYVYNIAAGQTVTIPLTMTDANAYAVVAEDAEDGTVSVDKELAVIGETVTITATPNRGYALSSIRVNGTEISGNTFTMPARAVTVSAVFVPIDYTVSVGEVENGTISVDRQTARVRERVTVTAVPDEGYKLLKIRINGAAVSGTTFTMPAEDVVVTAAFVKQQYTITTEEAEAGVVTVDKTSATFDEVITVTALPAYGYGLSCIKVNGVAIAGNTFVMPKGNVVVTAEFSKLYMLGDIDGDEDVDISDAVLLFQHSMLPDIYPIEYTGSVDFNKDGVVDVNDAVLLFQHSMLPEIYPIG